MTTEPLQTVEDGATALWANVTEVWQTSFLGASIGDGILAMLVLMLGLALRGLISRWIIGALKGIADKTQTTMDNAVLDALSGPLKLIPVIIGLFVAIQILGFEGPFMAGTRLIQSLIAVVIFWALHNAVKPVLRSMAGLRRVLSTVMLDWIEKSLRVIFVIVGYPGRTDHCRSRPVRGGGRAGRAGPVPQFDRRNPDPDGAPLPAG